ncbi:ClpX C4-type zinc finger protein [Planotetraspora phitsanulokensis]|uniref:ClpX-type ZB domain-containing protein n=1 Tax=Planotetraspora phitsanulokensis TaxID=575192 RepID=A0A8J3U3I7_9ACTN|nr:ClpX C4-type zinc finger protein [Planotetraspora phitsanulokensis]GII36312.1 hypothetical protein Pph01_13150 [Planotetraspora phitsanulokensis]
MAASAKAKTIVQCSFCGKPQTEVQKVIAGPGVYICNECVRLCLVILEAEETSPTPQIPAWDTMTDEQILEILPKFAAAGRQVEDSLQAWVTRLRERKVTWTRIGETLGMTRQSAWERFSGEE